jgi:hypothetical protein
MLIKTGEISSILNGTAGGVCSSTERWVVRFHLSCSFSFLIYYVLCNWRQCMLQLMERLGKHSSECWFTVILGSLARWRFYLITQCFRLQFFPSVVASEIWRHFILEVNLQTRTYTLPLILICVVRWLHTGATQLEVDWCVNSAVWNTQVGYVMNRWMWISYRTMKCCHNLFLAPSWHSLERSGKIMSSLRDASQSTVSCLRDLNILFLEHWPNAFVINDVAC